MMAAWRHHGLWIFLSWCLAVGQEPNYDGVIFHEVPEFYEADNVTLKNSSGKTAIRFFTPRAMWRGADFVDYVVGLLKEQLRDINLRSDILPDHVVELHIVNSYCQPQYAVPRAISAIHRNPEGYFHFVFGPSCSLVAGPMNEVMQAFNLLMVAPISRDAALADRSRYPYMCRSSPPLSMAALGIVRLCKLFGWSRVGAVADNNGLAQGAVMYFMAHARLEAAQGYAFDIPWMESALQMIPSVGEIPATVARIRKLGVKIAMLALYESNGVFFVCEMYKLGYHGPIMQPISITTWYADTWVPDTLGWMTAFGMGPECSAEQIYQAAHGYLGLGQTTFFPSDTLKHGVTGKGLSFIKERYAKLCREPGALGCHDEYASYEYDSLAWAVHVFHKWVHEEGHDLSELDYHNPEARDQLFKTAVDTAFIGTSGVMSFYNDSTLACERQGSFSVTQYRPNVTGWSDYGWAIVTSYKEDTGFAAFSDWHPIIWGDGTETYMGDGKGWGDSEPAPGKVLSFGNAVGLENPPADRLACPIGEVPTEDRSACMACPEGTVSGEVGSFDCEPCAVGTFADSKGLGSCNFCPPGTHQANTGASSCDDCPAGTVSDPLALWQCVPCTRGHFTGEEGQSECSFCGFGTYADTMGMSECTKCEGDYMTTTYMAATSPKACHCSETKYRDPELRTCQECPKGMECPEGADLLNFPRYANVTERGPDQRFPLLQRGYMSSSAEPLSVYMCIRENMCPGQIPGQACAKGREGIACGKCLGGFAEAAKGMCEECDPGSTALPSALIVIAGVCVVGVATLNVNTNWQKISSSIVLFLTVAGILTANVQVMAVFRRSALQWEHPLSAILEAVSIASFEIDGLKANCVLGSDPVRRYIARQCMVPICAPLIFVTLMIKRRWFKTSMADIFVQITNTVGTICNLFFISIMVSAVSSMYCYEHPDDMGYSMVTNPSILCFESSSHTTMLTVTVIATLCVPVPYAALVAWSTYRYPSMVNSNAARDLFFMRALRFLFFRLHRHRYYYALVILGRNISICLTPVIFRDHVGLQVALLLATLSTFTIVQQQLCPWLSGVANIVDGTMAQLMVMLLVSGVMATPNLKGSAGFIGLVSFVVLSLLAFGVLFYAMCKLAVKQSKYYHMFICHHKREAAAQARFLKVLLEQQSKLSIFIDSDDLKDLEQLFDIVRKQVKHLVVYLTEFTMSRPWCAGEIASAVASQVKITGVITPAFVRPSEAELEDLPLFIEDYANSDIEDHGVSLDMLANGFKQFLSQDSFIEMNNDDRGRGRLTRVAAKLLGKQASVPNDAITVTPGNVVISADPRDDEGIAAAAILAGEIKMEVVRRTWVQICFLADHEDDLEALSAAVLSSTALLVLLSRNSLESLSQLVAIVEVTGQGDKGSASFSNMPSRSTTTAGGASSPKGMSARRRSVTGHCVIPVHIPGFAFPQKDYFEKDLPRLWPARASEAQDCLKLFFEKIAVFFPVHASDKVIRSHTTEILERIDFRRKSTHSAADPNSLKVRSWARIPDEYDDCEVPMHISNSSPLANGSTSLDPTQKLAQAFSSADTTLPAASTYADSSDVVQESSNESRESTHSPRRNHEWKLVSAFDSADSTLPVLSTCADSTDAVQESSNEESRESTHSPRRNHEWL